VLRSELTQFLEAIASADESERRRYERIAGNGTMATLRVAGGQEVRAAITNVSRGGLSLQTNWWAEAGTEVQILLPGCSVVVSARTVRTQDGKLALAFRQDETMLRQVDLALDHIGRQATVAAAA
jgi:hypothetical protein